VGPAVGVKHTGGQMPPWQPPQGSRVGTAVGAFVGLGVFVGVGVNVAPGVVGVGVGVEVGATKPLGAHMQLLGLPLTSGQVDPGSPAIYGANGAVY